MKKGDNSDMDKESFSLELNLTEYEKTVVSRLKKENFSDDEIKKILKEM